MVPDDEWTFCAVTIEPDKATFYVNGVAGSVNTISHGPCNWNSNIYLGGDGNVDWVGRRMDGALDDVAFYSRALTADEIMVIMNGLGDYPTAGSPNPPDGAMLQDTWVTLSWRPGDFAVSTMWTTELVIRSAATRPQRCLSPGSPDLPIRMALFREQRTTGESMRSMTPSPTARGKAISGVSQFRLRPLTIPIPLMAPSSWI